MDLEYNSNLECTHHNNESQTTKLCYISYKFSCRLIPFEFLKHLFLLNKWIVLMTHESRLSISARYYVVVFFPPKLPPAFYLTESNPCSTHAPPTVWANLNLPAVSVFSHPPPPTWHPRLFHLHPKYQPRVTSFPALLLCARIFVSHTHSRRERAHECVSRITWLIPPPMLVGRNFFPASCGPCNFPFSLSWTGVVTYKPSRSCPQAPWLMPNCLDTAYSLQCVAQEWTDDLDMHCFAFCIKFNAELNGPAELNRDNVFKYNPDSKIWVNQCWKMAW